MFLFVFVIYRGHPQPRTLHQSTELRHLVLVVSAVPDVPSPHHPQKIGRPRTPASPGHPRRRRRRPEPRRPPATSQPCSPPRRPVHLELEWRSGPCRVVSEMREPRSGLCHVVAQMRPPRALPAPVGLDPTSAVGAQADERGLDPGSAGGHATSHSHHFWLRLPRVPLSNPLPLHKLSFFFMKSVCSLIGRPGMLEMEASAGGARAEERALDPDSA
mgnify:CR=1 FL=1